MREEDMELEMEVNNELQNSGKEVDYSTNEENENSQDSEFVEATQNFTDFLDSQSTADNAEDSELDLEELERRNKAFLDQSWANIMENNEAEQILLKDMEADDTLEQPVNIDEFQVVANRKLKKKPASSKSVYNTRGKTGVSKPFR
jgi:hypothetical protein